MPSMSVTHHDIDVHWKLESFWSVFQVELRCQTRLHRLKLLETDEQKLILLLSASDFPLKDQPWWKIPFKSCFRRKKKATLSLLSKALHWRKKECVITIPLQHKDWEGQLNKRWEVQGEGEEGSRSSYRNKEPVWGALLGFHGSELSACLIKISWIMTLLHD